MMFMAFSIKHTFFHMGETNHGLLSEKTEPYYPQQTTFKGKHNNPDSSSYSMLPPCHTIKKNYGFATQVLY